MTLRMLSDAEAAERDARDAEWREASAPADEPHLLYVDGDEDLPDSDDGPVYDWAVTVHHTEECGADGAGGVVCLASQVQNWDGTLPFGHVSDPDDDHPVRLAPGSYWITVRTHHRPATPWSDEQEWFELELCYPEEAQP